MMTNKQRAFCRKLGRHRRRNVEIDIDKFFSVKKMSFIDY